MLPTTNLRFLTIALTLCGGFTQVGCALISPPVAPVPSLAMVLLPDEAPPTATHPSEVASPVLAAEKTADKATEQATKEAAEQAAHVANRHVLTYFERLRAMSQQELSLELQRLNSAPGGPATTLETALALGQNRAAGDLQRSLASLDSLMRINTPEVMAWRPIARLLFTRFSEQRKMEEQLERQNGQLKENQRKIEQLSEKLEALKAIERSLTVRQQSLAPGPGKMP